jgi:thioester reductase-like protein
MEILVTGGSGFLGAAMLPSLVRDNKVKKILLLLRDSPKQPAKERLNSLVEKVFAPNDREFAMSKMEVVAGDLTLDAMGLDSATRERLENSCTHILHIGASTDFAAPIAESRHINVEGTRKLLDLAVVCREKGKLERFDYVSTAFVAGTKSGVVTEDDLDRSQNFANAYEQSKFEAELLVRDYKQILPTTIYRPSIVVGDSRNGFTPHFKVLYWPLQLLSKNIIPFVPCSRKARLDIVPVDFVANSMYKIMMTRKSLGKTFYLTAGAEKGVRIDELLNDAFEQTNIQRRPLIPVWVFKLLRGTWLRRLMSEDFWRTCELAAVYNDYLSGTNVVFDNRKSTAFLRSLGAIPAPHWKAYGKAILAYCTESKWGRKLRMPEFQYRNPHLQS